MSLFPFRFILAAALGCTSVTSAQTLSHLWGRDGERWSPVSRLPDFSFAGYERGEKPLPSPPPGPSVRDFGAVGDGVADDTEAFLRAIRETESGPIEIPPGRYLVTGILSIEKPNLILRGAGSDKSTLHFPQSLTDIEPDWTTNGNGDRVSRYSWSGGFIRVSGSQSNPVISPVAGPAQRGDYILTVEDASSIAAGDEVLLSLQDTERQTLAHYLYAGQPGDISKLGAKLRFSQVFRILAIDGNRLTLDRPLRAEVRTEWAPELRRFTPSVTHVGIEGLTLSFPDGEYQGHFTERGFNGIGMSRVAHCWVRDVRMVNAESGLFLSGTFNTVQGLVLDSSRAPDRRGNRGHHAITLGGSDNLLTGFQINALYIHDVTVSVSSVGNVFSRGRGEDLSLDHHRRAPYENLFTDLHAGRGTRLWNSGGARGLGRHSGARGTFWNISADQPFPLPKTDFAPDQINLVGLHMSEAPSLDSEGRWIEPLPPGQLHPANLHLAQLQRRLATQTDQPGSSPDGE